MNVLSLMPMLSGRSGQMARVLSCSLTRAKASKRIVRADRHAAMFEPLADESIVDRIGGQATHNGRHAHHKPEFSRQRSLNVGKQKVI